MTYRHLQKNSRGMTLVEVIFAAALMLLVFGGIFSALQTISTLIGSSKAQAGAVSLANEKMEYIRSLPYDSVGTISGIPNGPIPQTATKSLNGLTYTERVLITYIDDPKDGSGASDSNSILADYKLAKVSYSWTEKGTTKTISLLSNIIPRGIETTAGGGTLVVNVFDASVVPISGASVRVYNNTGTTTIDTTRYTNISGVAIFSGAPARSGYQITVTDTGYSTDQTFNASTTNPNPSTPHVAVLESQVSTMNFQIDRLSSLALETMAVPTVASFEDTFMGTTTIATSSNISISSGVASIFGGPSSYLAKGTLTSNTITPSPLASWDTLSTEGTTPAGTTLKVRVYSVAGTSTPILIPDTTLPGNALGFNLGSISLSSLTVGTYPSIALQAFLYSSSTATTPTLASWKVAYTNSNTALASIPITITGAKRIGMNGVTPVYKYSKSITTNGSGLASLTALEWDMYDVIVTNPAYDVAEACKNIPYVLTPGVNETLTLILAPAVTYSQRVTVIDASGNEIPNAGVRLTRGGFDQTHTTTACGQTMFNSGLSTATDYDLTVSAFGYVSQTLTALTIDGAESLVVTLVAS
jgi:hypothetical protein